MKDFSKNIQLIFMVLSLAMFGFISCYIDGGNTGTFTATTTQDTGPNGEYTLVYPLELGQGGMKHPVIGWGNGGTLTPSYYTTLLNTLASHGFVVVAYNTTPGGQELIAGIDWMLSENSNTGSIFYNMLNEGKVAAMGHSMGSTATFEIAGDLRLVTTIHISGGTLADHHTDIENLHAPAAFICGDAPVDGFIIGDVAQPNCEIDFQNATTPVFYGHMVGQDHLTTPRQSSEACADWLEWLLLGNNSLVSMFVGEDCGLCSNPDWEVKQKNW
jgi:hypothetical protein